MSCENKVVEIKPLIPKKPVDFEELKKRGELVILTENTSTSYYNYRGQIMGFEYDILSDFADSFNLNLKVNVLSNSKKFPLYLNQKKGDIIACNYTVTEERKKQHNFSYPYLNQRLVLVQRKSNKKIVKIKDLNNIIIHVRKHSSYYNTLLSLKKKHNLTFTILDLKEDLPTEDFVSLVAKGKIDYTVSEENIAKLVALNDSSIDVQTILSEPFPIAFGIRHDNIQFKDSLDCWLKDYVNSDRYKNLISLYYRIPDTLFKNKNLKNIYQISEYDSLFKESGKNNGIDWILMSSIAYQETRFNPSAIGPGGSYSMMQFMPNTGPGYGVYEDSPVPQQIEGGTKMIKKLLNKYKHILLEEDRIKFSLAAYNAGYCHVNDAMKLAEKYDLNPYLWKGNVKEMMLNLNDSNYYNDSVVKCGAYRGMAVKYAEEVYNRFRKWKLQYK